MDVADGKLREGRGSYRSLWLVGVKESDNEELRTQKLSVLLHSLDFQK
jgi:hypothetical protein